MQEAVQHKAVENVYRLFQLPADRSELIKYFVNQIKYFCSKCGWFGVVVTALVTSTT